MGVLYPNWQYNQLGIVATLKLSEPTENVVAWQRFLPTGPIALLPTGVSRQLQPSVAAIVEGSRAAFPLGFGHAASYVQPGTVLVGDAAHRIHPLAGQGVNLGFGDVTVLTKILAEAAVNGSHLNDMQYLRQYETLRQRHNVPTMLVIDALHRLYRGTAAPVVLARSLGLQLTNAIPQLKKMLMEQAAGGTTVKC
ncbi:ubiquinone biosynthesis monooxygenase coq6 [Lasius niger]|uniref:Ubiquinone biosynthesis monooxygenase coq6 n=1 Tax=Lasius niger TaxID=67767 RepID=A0A0J7KY06_LASNI|nr:ubiquinone biosynthesis monooxygenase coq6 [Lasius niger]